MFNQTIEITEVSTDGVYRKAAFALYMKSKIMTDLLKVMTHRERLLPQILTELRE
jgi:hypothetical protein